MATGTNPAQSVVNESYLMVHMEWTDCLSPSSSRNIDTTSSTGNLSFDGKKWINMKNELSSFS